MGNFFYNVYNLVKSLFRVKIFWGGNITLQDNCIIDRNTKIGAPFELTLVTIGFGTYIASNSKVSQTTIGKFCSIGPNFLCGWGIHPSGGISTSPAFYSMAKQNGFTYSKTNKITERKPIIIGNDVFIGANVIVLDGITIGDGAIIGAGAVVSKNVPPYAIAIGCPIEVVKYRFEKEKIEMLLELKWWDKNDTVYKKVEEHFWDIDAFVESLKTTTKS